jgi:hypothetical protein
MAVLSGAARLLAFSPSVRSRFTQQQQVSTPPTGGFLLALKE